MKAGAQQEATRSWGSQHGTAGGGGGGGGGGGAYQINSADIKGQRVVQHVFSETDSVKTKADESQLRRRRHTCGPGQKLDLEVSRRVTQVQHAAR